jgi:hypothetical protein
MPPSAASLFRVLASVLATLVLSGCGHVPVASMLKLSRVDFATTDPALLRAAVTLPWQLRPRGEGMRMRVAVKIGNGPEETQDFALRKVSDAADQLRNEVAPGTALFAYRIDPADLPRLQALRAGLLAKKKEGMKGSLSISIRPETCRVEPLPQGPVLFSTYLRTGETANYVPLARDVDLRSLDPTRDVAALIPPCG